jgi:uncharacterized membrane protein
MTGNNTGSNCMQRQALTLVVIGIVLVISGSFVSFYGTERREETKTGREFVFGSYYFIDYSTNRTYQGAGTADVINIPYGDTIEILPIKTPDNFNGTIGSFHYLVWNGGAKANLPGNNPTEIITASQLPVDYRTSNNDVSFELVADNNNATWNSIVSSSVFNWYGTFILYHVISANPTLFMLGLVIIICGIVSILSATTSFLTSVKQKRALIPRTEDTPVIKK